MDRVSGASASSLTSNHRKPIMQIMDELEQEHLASLSESERRAIAQREERAKQYFLRDVDGTSVEVIPERKRT